MEPSPVTISLARGTVVADQPSGAEEDGDDAVVTLTSMDDRLGALKWLGSDEPR
jgi:hypothetical protein